MATTGMLIESEKNLVLKRVPGTKAKQTVDMIYVNAANVGCGHPNSPKGFATLADLLENPPKKLGSIEGYSVRLIARGLLTIEEAIVAFRSGEVLAHQYLAAGKDEPYWGISVGYLTDVADKNAEYGKKGGKKSRKPAATRKKASKQEDFS